MSGPDQRETEARLGNLMWIGVAATAALALAGGIAFYYASQLRTTAEGETVRVAVTAAACEPNALTVPAGKHVFEIANRSERPVEWEILDGVMVIEERENIAPGFSQTLSADLAPGTYEITCGLLSNPRGTLTVTPSKTQTARAEAPALKAFIGPLSEYKVFLALQGGKLVASAGALEAAIAAGDREAARTRYQETRRLYKTLEPLARRFADLQSTIDPLADYLGQREEDPGFTGFHRIEYGLWGKNDTNGLTPFAQKLTADLATLKGRLREVKLQPGMMVASADSLTRQIAEARLVKGEDHYAQTDLADAEASLEGIGKIVDLLSPVIVASAPEVATALTAALDKARARLADLKDDAGFPRYAEVDAEGRQRLADAFTGLADALDQLEAATRVG
ncbi:iron uptake system protein EfeO [Mangrovibrevibacter kandeliae]|uniref:iron uptake system protein EfeO n=1 Tax=Mangrovibrevibacter kandeliae TaxID=2968473 RepID=UPI0021197724|nr:iron uptake system protein EfeO [Aurantimonas sp. CSK15Z-1]MCQ8783707.1 iron uptake system protein EfeO [Aurantimonas sp. CSK15Z-1]